MRAVDIREEDGTPIDRVIFGSHNEALSWRENDPSDIIFVDEDNCTIESVQIKDIPNLIKALQKAQELWGKK